MYRRAYEETEPTSPSGRVEQIRSEDLLTLVGKLSDAIPGVIPNALENQLEQSIPTTSPGGVVGTHGEIFTETSLSSRGDSTEIGVPLEAVDEALDAIFDVSDDYQFGAPVALRYIAPSDALLGLGAFEPVTCAIELPGIDSKRAREAYENGANGGSRPGMTFSAPPARRCFRVTFCGNLVLRAELIAVQVERGLFVCQLRCHLDTYLDTCDQNTG